MASFSDSRASKSIASLRQFCEVTEEEKKRIIADSKDRIEAPFLKLRDGHVERSLSDMKHGDVIHKRDMMILIENELS